jgi:arabinose-5-phosphate isomerase
MHKGTELPLISPDAAFREALIEMTAKGLGCVCIIDAGNRLVGLITDGDVRRALQNYDDIRLLRVAEVMTNHPLGVLPETTLGMALALMEDRPKQLSVLPVTDAEGQCLGIIRIHDIIRADL